MFVTVDHNMLIEGMEKWVETVLTWQTNTIINWYKQKSLVAFLKAPFSGHF